MGRKRTKQQLEKALTALKNKTPKFKLMLDSKTIITVSKMEKVEFWKQKYPNAKLI